ncbi:MAG: hypothetical protein WBA74_26870 [Cyclobacteriaceae bacterium]
MIKFNYTLFICFLTIARVWAQPQFNKYKPEWSKEYDNKSDKDLIMQIIGQDDEGFYALGESYRMPQQGPINLFAGKYFNTISYYTNDLEKRNSRMLSTVLQEDEEVERVLQMRNGKFYIISSTKIADRSLGISARRFKAKTLDISTNKKKLHKVPENKLRGNKRYEYDFILSEDKSKLLLYYMKRSGSKDLVSIGLIVYDEKLDVISENEYDLAYKSEVVEISDVRILNDATVHVLAAIREENISEYALLTAKLSKSQLASTSMYIDNQYLTELLISDSKNGMVTCGGFYSEEGFNTVAGTYFAKINTLTGELEKQNAVRFDNEFALKGEWRHNKLEKLVKKGREVLSDYWLDRAIPREDGGLTLIAEQYRRLTLRNNFGTNFSTLQYIHMYIKILVISIDHQGNIEWNKKVNKNQEIRIISDLPHGSYKPFYHNGMLYLLFNDHEDNLLTDENSKVNSYNGHKGFSKLVTLDRSGQMGEYPIYLQTGKGPTMIPKSSAMINNNLIIVASNPKVQRLGKVKLDKG